MTGWDLSCPDWKDRLAAGTSLVPSLPLDLVQANRAVAAFDKLRLPDVIGQPLLRDSAGDWFRDIVRAVFGSVDRDSNLRYITDVFALVPKKNSKTTNGAALMLVALILNWRPQALFGLFGPTQEISDRAFKAATGMIAADKDLARILKPQFHLKTITNLLTKAELRVTTFDPSVATGGLYAGWLLDELHLLSKSANAADIIGQLRGARISVTESFGIIITTQSERPPAGAFKTELDYARKVRDGVIPASGFLPVLYEYPEEIQTDPAKPWLDPALWPQVQPNLNRSVSLAVLESEFAREKVKGEEAIRRWASQHLNIEIGLALHNDRWTGADYWLAAAEPALTLDELIERSEVATVGIDGGGLDDLLGLAVIGRCRRTKRWLHWGHAWADPTVLDRRPLIASQLRQFEADGDLTFVEIVRKGDQLEPPTIDLVRGDEGEWATTPVGTDLALGNDASYLDGLVATVVLLKDAGLLPDKYAVGLDSAGVTAIEQALRTAGLVEEGIAAVPQGYGLSGTIVGVAIKLAARSFRHGGQPIMRWCVENAKAELKGQSIMVTKQTAGAAKIDLLMALFDAAYLMSHSPQAGGSVYSARRGLLVFG